jgi:hypothetical protein
MNHKGRQPHRSTETPRFPLGASLLSEGQLVSFSRKSVPIREIRVWFCAFCFLFSQFLIYGVPLDPPFKVER